MHFIRRHYFRRFLRPINKLKLTPEVVGRTMFVGLLWGLSASVGFQLIFVALFWLIGRWADRPFNFPIALLLTGITNPLTITPIYSAYFFIGCSLLPSCQPAHFSVKFLLERLSEEGPWSLLADSWSFLTITFFASLPFAVAAGVAGYWFGRTLGERLHKRRQKRAAARLAHRRPHPRTVSQ